MHRWIWAAGLCALLLTGVRPVMAVEASASRVTAVLINPRGATLRPGDPLQCTAVAVDKHGRTVPGVTIKWSSSRSAIASIDNSGAVTTGGPLGRCSIIARAGKKSANIPVTVVASTSNGATLAAGLGAVNDVAADDAWVYWTQNDKTVTRLRKTPKEGGPIYDLASLPVRDRTQLKYAFYHIRQSEDTLYVSRLVTGYARHWSILAVPKAGGPLRSVVKDNASVQLDLATGWQLVGQYLVISFADPTVVKLDKDTRLAAYNLQNGVWTPLISNKFNAGQVIATGADAQYVYVRAYTAQTTTVTLQVDPAGLENSYKTLSQQNRADVDLAVPLTTDGTALYFWTQSGTNDPALARLPLDGTAGTGLLGGNFGVGLNADGGKLYWVRGGTLVSLPTGGSAAPASIQTGVYGTASLRRVELDADSFFLVRKSGKYYQIVRVDRAGR